MTAPSTSRIASDAACAADTRYSWMCRSMFSITTIASSTTMPVARMMPNSVSVLMEKPISLTNAKAPMSETGMVMAGISVLRHVCRNTKITRTTSAIASTSVLRTSVIDSSTTSVVLTRDLILHSRRELRLEPFELGDDRSFEIQRVRCWQLDDAEANGFNALEPQLARIGLRTELGAPDVFQPDERAARHRS